MHKIADGYRNVDGTTRQESNITPVYINLEKCTTLNLRSVKEVDSNTGSDPMAGEGITNPTIDL